MSQHYYSTRMDETTILITLGWDRPLRYFFMTIENEEKRARGEEDYMIYSNLDQDNAFPTWITSYQEVLKSMGIELPAYIFDEVIDDAFENVGSKVVWHNPRNWLDGQILREVF